MRNLKADLELCQKATPGQKVRNIAMDIPNKTNVRVVAEFREGWLYALELLYQVAYGIQNNKGMNGAVYLDERLEEQILTILEGETLE